MDQTVSVEPQPVAPLSSGRQSSSDSFVDAALDFLSDEGSAEKPVQNDRPKKKAPEPDPEQEPGDAETPLDDGEDEDAELPAAEDEEEHEEDSRGSKDEPYTIKDLPKDRYIELKVDGEKLVVSLDELATGYQREQVFNRRLNKTKLLSDEAQSMLAKAVEIPKKVRAEFQTFVRDPDQLFEFFTATEEREQVLETVARQYAEMRRHFRERPDAKLAWQRKRDVERIEYEREQFETQKRTELESKAREERNAKAIAIFKPGWETGLKRAGFPQPTKELYDEVLLRCQQRSQAGEEVTSEDVATFVARAAKLLELPPAQQKPKAPVRAAAPTAKPKTKTRDDWAKVPVAQRRKDPDFFLRNLRAKDFR